MSIESADKRSGGDLRKFGDISQEDMKKIREIKRSKGSVTESDLRGIGLSPDPSQGDVVKEFLRRLNAQRMKSKIDREDLKPTKKPNPVAYDLTTGKRIK